MTVASTTTETPALSPARTPRARFRLTRRLVGVSRWPLVLLTAVYAINVSDQYLLPSVFPLLKSEFGLSDTSLGILSGSYLVIVTVLTVPFGTLADRHTRTKIIAWGTAAWGVTMLWTGLARNYLSLLASRMMLGAWDPCDNPTSQSLLADYYPVAQRTKVMSVYQIGQLFGIFLLPLAGAIATAWGWRAAFYFFALPAFVVALLAWRLPEPVRGQQDRRHQNLATQTEVPSEYDTMPWREAYRDVLRVRTFAMSVISSGIGSLFFGSVGVWSATYMVRYHDFTLTQAATATGLFALGGLVGALASGYVADALTQSGQRSARIIVAAVTRILSFPLFFLTFTVDNPAIMLALFTLGSVMLVAAQAPLNAARADVLHPSLRGRGTSLDAVVQSIGGAAAPIVVGVLADAFSLRTAFQLVSPIVGLAGLVLLLFGVPFYARDETRMRDTLHSEAIDAARAGGADAATLEAMVLHDPEEERRRLRRDDVVLEIVDLSFAYGSIQVLFETAFELPRGGCHALVGRNGVGKTTLLNNIAGLLDAQSGRILYDGVDLTGVPSEQRVRLGITLMAGGRSTFPTLSVADNLWIGTYPFLDDEVLLRERLDAVFDVFPELKDRLSQPGGTLSGGEQQMLALGRALMAGPELLLVDELSLGLAPRVTHELLQVVRRIRELGTTVLIVEQSVSVALEVADSVFFMDKGVVQSLGAAAEVGDDLLIGMMMNGTKS